MKQPIGSAALAYRSEHIGMPRALDITEMTRQSLRQYSRNR